MGINIENLVMEYKKGVKSLDHINLNIDQGIYEIEVRFVNGRKPEFLCELCTPNLEDAYIYNMYVKEND